MVLVLPPPNTALNEDEQTAIDVAADKSPKSVVLPALAIVVIYCITSTI